MEVAAGCVSDESVFLSLASPLPLSLFFSVSVSACCLPWSEPLFLGHTLCCLISASSEPADHGLTGGHRLTHEPNTIPEVVSRLLCPRDEQVSKPVCHT